MSRTGADSAGIEQSFREQLRSLVEEAHEHDLDIDRNWTCRAGDGVPDYEVEFVRLQDRSD
ncbi:hypothetical protein GJ633_05590 [Halorubrum sp. CBA1125]|uniref:hypothetical protein n=1 Tax=Halorubrum sp. CBA1125 TaxID=2668072 RepID=UPI0012E8898E|nr:hypothetical protein [Halorubrum sp. CBA1125]MUW14188.1 hypothetical protein [Halorubrum sp. CBA1125]